MKATMDKGGSDRHAYTAGQRPTAIRAGRMGGLFLVGVFLVAVSGQLAADDWPQWRLDANRSGATDQPGPGEPSLLWRLVLDYPDPAYDHQFRMCADLTYAPVAAEGLVFFPSSVTDRVTACDLQTSVVKWQSVAEGPVRFAPVYRDGMVYFVSDDGYLYCVSAQEGRSLWKVRGVPESLPDSRMLVGGRLSSRWPARGAPVEHQGVIYFGAGIWPEEGVYVTAVDAETGGVLWRSDSMSYIKDGMSDHGRPYDLSLPPQGYLAVIDGKLAVPSGRSLAAWFDTATGTMEPYTCFYVKHNPPRGTWHLAGINQYSVQGGNWFGTRSTAEPPLPPKLSGAKSALFWSRQPTENELHVIKNRPFLRADTYLLHPENLYTDPVLTKTTMYASEFMDERRYLVPRGHTHVSFPEYDRIVARDLTRPHWGKTVQMHLMYGRGKVTMPRLEFPARWELKSPLRVLIKAGDRLVAGGKDTIAAIAIPDEGEDPRIVWQAPIDGTPVHALVADRKLVVATHNGNMYCFGDGGETGLAASRHAKQKNGPHGCPRNGYALRFGYGDGTQAKALAHDEHYRVIVLEPDPAKAAEARAALAQAGLYGRQVQVIQSDLTNLRLTPYWANLVVIESLDGFESPERALSVALDALRPFTGTLRCFWPQNQLLADLLRRLLSGRTGYEMKIQDSGITIHRKSPPDGFDDWTHESGGAANRFANSERWVKWPLAALWYSGDIDRYFTPASHFQHERHPYPLVVGGRMFLITGQLLHAVDIYTGSYLWRAELPMTPWIQTRLFDSRVYGRPTDCNYLASEDRVYAITGRKVHAYDTATGKQVNVFRVPAQLEDEAEGAIHEPQQQRYMGHQATVQAVPQWTEVRLWKDLLLAMLGRKLVALDRRSGEVRWTRQSTRQTTTYALGADTLFGLDCDVPKTIGGDDRATVSGLLLALDPETGGVVWQKRPQYASVPKHEVQNPRIWLRPIVPVLSYNPKHGLIVMTVNRNSLHVFRAADGQPVWSKTNPGLGNVQRIYPPVVTDDYLVLSDYKGCFGYLLDIRTGREVGQDTGIPAPRTCARIIGNNNLLVYRDAATELYDIQNNRMVGLNSLRSGCTTSFIPAGGVMTAPMLGHGCVCNYPMFASLGLYHWPEIDLHRPASVTQSWVNQAEQLFAQTAGVPDPLTSAAGKIDLENFRLINGTVEAAGSAMRLSIQGEGVGYAVRESDSHLEKAVFAFALKRTPGTKRHGNALFVCGPSGNPADWIECRLYYGGRSSMMITGRHVEPVEEKITPKGTSALAVTVGIDCNGRTVTFQAAGNTLTAKITDPFTKVTHFGYGGANSDNVLTDISVRRLCAGL